MIRTIRITESKSGMFFATSEEGPAFFVSAIGADQLWDAIPRALEDMLRHCDKLEVRAIPTDVGHFGLKPRAIVPMAALAQLASAPR